MKKKILIVDDDQHIRNSLSAILSSEDYITNVAEDKNTAFQQIKTNTPELILMDVHMSSEQEGYEIVEELQDDYQFKNIPVIIMTNTEIISGNGRIVEMAKRFRNTPQFDYINAVLTESEDGQKIVEYKSVKTSEIVKLPVQDVISKPFHTPLLLDSIKKVLDGQLVN